MNQQLDLFAPPPDRAGDTPRPTPRPTIKMPENWKIGDRVQVKATLEVGRIAAIMSDRWLAFVEFEHRNGFYYPHSELINLGETPQMVREQWVRGTLIGVREQPLEPIEDEGLNVLPNKDWKTNGYVEVKEIRGHHYRYWRWREGQTLKSHYLGKAIGASPPASE